jgi:hypothetical protein
MTTVNMQKIEEAEAHLWRIFNSIQTFVWQSLDEDSCSNRSVDWFIFRARGGAVILIQSSLASIP